MLTEEQKNSPFNEEYDKITDAEVVYDFVERLKLGRDLNSTDTVDNELNSDIESKTLFKAKSYLLNAISYIMSCLPSSLAYDTDNTEIVRIKIPKGKTRVSYNKIVDDGLSCYIAAAYTDRLKIDLTKTGMIHMDAQANLINISISFDTPYPSDDVINIYIKHQK